MAWARIEDSFFSHPKVRKAGKDAVILYMAALCHSNAYVTEGYIADEVLELIGMQAFLSQPKKAADKLVECELFVRTESGYIIHDFLDYNYSRKQIDDLRAKRTEAGRQGGRPIKQNETKMKANENQIGYQNETKMKANEKQNETHTHSHINNHTNKDKEEVVATVFTAYESEIGVLTAAVSEGIKSALEDYPAEWIVEAIKESALQNKRNWKYALAILKRWKAEGRGADNRKKTQGQDLDHWRAIYRQSKEKKDV